MKLAALHVLDRNGVVRKLTHSRPDALPYRMKRYREVHSTGSYMTMEFDAHPSTMESLLKAVAFEEHVIRHNVIKLGDSVKKTASLRPETIGAS
ncbi:hypothetical protein SmJEL517_g02332 [Synchytrium microbalum]|uniref:30S ribosomal protein S6 n=1 Tax=Synchytrium microbalum TaxID=1806994 RepID=A0A507C723_9FUNG|nr:uncharacterized protein SmJEL517_g02332 [Synchytrium microbalum]TPX35301.1 hypothetical protein SmJEL517_g02332 [Synchytrium microbalum]